MFVDTLYVVALTNSRDQYHQKALHLARRVGNQPMVTTEAVLVEIGNALARNFKSDAVKIIEKFTQSDLVEVIPMDPDLVERAFEMYKTFEDKAWGLTDCISFVVMQDRGISDALTFDHHFAQAGFRVLMRELPE